MTARALDLNPGNVTYVDETTTPVTLLGSFWPGKHSLAELIAAATAVERTGNVPEIRFGGNGKDPECIELVMRDIPALIGKLRSSLAVTPAKEASTRGNTKGAIACGTRGEAEQ